MFPGKDILERKFEGYSDAEIFAMVTDVYEAGEATLQRRGTSLAELQQQAAETAAEATPTDAPKAKGRGRQPKDTLPPSTPDGTTDVSGETNQ